MPGLLSMYPKETQALIAASRKFLLGTLRGVKETIDKSSRVIGYGYAPGYKGLVCTLILSQKEVKIGIVGGSRIPDRWKLLQGSGKVHRYIRVRSVADLRQPGVRQIIKLAHAFWRDREFLG